ncbi:MAG: methyl-accepting chemotaxis protein, partial [Chloroflexi bacterium]|nr:methyl-accepting chemotaxis protein [Chloroflexota bacterium]
MGPASVARAPRRRRAGASPWPRQAPGGGFPQAPASRPLPQTLPTTPPHQPSGRRRPGVAGGVGGAAPRAIVTTRYLLVPLTRPIVRTMLFRLLRRASDTFDLPPAAVAEPSQPEPETSETDDALAAMQEHQASLAGAAQAIASGDLAREVMIESEEDTLGIAFRDMLAGLRRLVGQVKDAAGDVDAGAQSAGGAICAADASVQQLHSAIEGIARGADEQIGQVQAAADAIAHVSGDVDQVASTAQELAEASVRARVAAERGADAVRATVQGIRGIADSTANAAGRVSDLDALSQKIGAVVATIDEIAEQTNLLALNAAIEAARAGGHGRGFAVVAGEVRKLAERSQRETHQIGELISNIQRETRETAQLILDDAEAAKRERERADQAGAALAELVAAVEAAGGQADAIVVSAQSATVATR